MALFDTAQALVGRPYVFGGGRGSDSSCDCSSYVANVFGQSGISLPAYTDAIAAATTFVGTDLSAAVPGDIILYRYSDPYQPGTTFPHVAIYAGGNNTYACQYPTGSGQYPVLNLPYEVHRADGLAAGSVGGGLVAGGPMGVVNWARSNPILAAGIAAAVFLLTRPMTNPGGNWQPDLFGGAHKQREAGKNRQDDLKRAREEMRDSGSRDLFDADHDARKKPRRNVQFFEEGGEIHPIRDSEGYSKGVEAIQREIRAEHAQADRYSDVKRGHGYGVIRPTWAVGFTDDQLERIARDHGTRATKSDWWKEAGLMSASRGRKTSDELRRLLSESGYRKERVRDRTDRAAERLRTSTRTRYRKPADLPF